MNRFPAAVLLLACTAWLSSDGAIAQDIPGVRTILEAERKIVSASKDASFRLTIEVQENASIPASLLTGIKLDCKVGDQPGAEIREGVTGGNVTVAAGTRIERLITLPVARLTLPAARPADSGADSAGGMATVAVQWPGLMGANCVLQIAPDLSTIDVDALDLAKTKVVLVTSHGDLMLSFYPDRAPETVKNFIKLSKSGFYDGTRFHRVIRNFMVQGGDPLTKDLAEINRWGTGDPGYKIRGEVNNTKHVRGVISMANSGSPDTAGSQFFICHKDAAHLNQGYTAFGALESGLDVLDSIANVPCGGPQRSRPMEHVTLNSAVVLPILK